MNSRNIAKGFTLIELLVVISIIVLLLSLLAPALDQALRIAEAARCGANQHAIGIGQGQYLVDQKRRYPQLSSYYSLMGNAGLHWGDTVTQRPLNAYLGFENDGTKVGMVECPSDLGDSLENPGFGATSSYEKWGSSYLPAFYHDPISRTAAVYGSTGAVYPVTGSKRQTSFKRTSNKLLMADWPWYGNRHYVNEVNRWHTVDAADRRFNTLFADLHVELFFFDRDLIEAGPSTDGYGAGNSLFGDPADSSFYWW